MSSFMLSEAAKKSLLEGDAEFVSGGFIHFDELHIDNTTITFILNGRDVGYMRFGPKSHGDSLNLRGIEGRMTYRTTVTAI